MSTPHQATFQTNRNKDFLRAVYDAQHVAHWCRRIGRPLKYLGLPAWEMRDIIEWQNHLGRFTTIEREENQQHLMFLRANAKDVEHRLYSLYGEFDHILRVGYDAYGKLPEWPYDLVNLDYYGGLIYSDLSRPEAIRKLIRNQATYRASFLLIITQDVRDADVKREKWSFLEDLGRSLKNSAFDPRVKKLIDQRIAWYARTKTPDSARQALYLNMFLRDTAEADYFDVTCRPAIQYAGTGGAVMMHFVTDLFFRSGISHKVASTQAVSEILNFPIREVRDGIRIQDKIIPGV